MNTESHVFHKRITCRTFYSISGTKTMYCSCMPSIYTSWIRPVLCMDAKVFNLVVSACIKWKPAYIGRNSHPFQFWCKHVSLYYSFITCQSASLKLSKLLLRMLRHHKTFYECLNLLAECSVCQVLMATNRPDTLDPALMRPGRLDRKVEFGLPDLEGRTHIFKIHARSMSVERDIRFELLARLCPNSTGKELLPLYTLWMWGVCVRPWSS